MMNALFIDILCSLPIDWMAACNKIFCLHSKLSCMLNMFNCVNNVRQCPNMKIHLKGITLATISASEQKHHLHMQAPDQKTISSDHHVHAYSNSNSMTFNLFNLNTFYLLTYWATGLKWSRFRTAYDGITCTLFHLANEGIPVATSLTIPV